MVFAADVVDWMGTAVNGDVLRRFGAEVSMAVLPNSDDHIIVAMDRGAPGG